jgi:hypothetical protein
LGVYNLIGRIPAQRAEKKSGAGVLRCSMCHCDRLAVKQLSGLEALISRLTGTRKYRCFVCRREFRAHDRRNRRRDAQGNVIRDELRIPV